MISRGRERNRLTVVSVKAASDISAVSREYALRETEDTVGPVVA